MRKLKYHHAIPEPVYYVYDLRMLRVIIFVGRFRPAGRKTTDKKSTMLLQATSYLLRKP